MLIRISVLSFGHHYVKESLCEAQTAFNQRRRVEDLCLCVVNVNGSEALHLCPPGRYFPTLLSLTPLFPDSFCLSLQLEVLHSQTLMLIRERWGDLVQEERYMPAKYLTLSVWKYDLLNYPHIYTQELHIHR